MLQITDIQHVTLAIAPVDAAGNPAPVQNVQWSAADSTMFTLSPSPDGLTCDVASTGKEGSSQVNVQADANLAPTANNPNPNLLNGSLQITVTNSEATAITITSGPPSDIVPPTPQLKKR